MKKVLRLELVLAAAMMFLTASSLGASEAGNQATFTAPLTWFAGGADNHSFANVLLSNASMAKDGSVVSGASGGTGELFNPVVTKGQITGLSATWSFTGQVTLEVSVTGNPMNYVRVTNGVPLPFQGLPNGSRIKWRATLAPQSSLSQVRIVYTDLSGVAGSFGSELLSGFEARKQIFVKGSEAGDLFQYQIQVKVGESQKSPDPCDLKLNGGVLSDFKDVRFTLADGETVVPQYLESVSGKAPDRLATFWIKIPEIPVDGLSLYMYFSRTGADDLSSGEKVFDLFEDFDGTVINPEKWKLTLGDKTGKAYVSDSLLFLEKAKLTTAPYVFADGILEYKASISGSGAVAGILRGTADGNNDLVAYASTSAGSEHAIAESGGVKVNDPQPIVPGVFYFYRIQCDTKGDVLFQRYGENGEGDAQAEVRVASGTSQSSPVGLSSSTQGHSVECAWIRTRRYAEPAPQIDPEKTATGLLETVDLPGFYDVVTAPDGGLVTKPDAMEGHYISRLIAPGFAARILNASWVMEEPPASLLRTSEDAGNVFVSISTKEGGAYVPGWENGITRYVSKKEFEQGGQLRWKVLLNESTGSTRTPAYSLTRFSLEYYPGTIRVVLPNSSSTLASGKPYRIYWDAPGFGLKYPMEISYATGEAREYKMIAAKTDNVGDFIWNVPDETAERAAVKVTDSFDKTIFGVSEGFFAIKASSSVSEEDTVSAVPLAQEAKDYLFSGNGKWSTAGAWAGAKIPDLTSQVNIMTNATLEADQPVAFHSLVIGDGVGNVTTTVVFKAGVKQGSGEIIIRKGGRLIQAGTTPVVLAGNLSIQSGGLLTHTSNGVISIAAKNISLEPGSTIDAEAKNSNNGGTVRLSAGGDFNISGTITASGDKPKGGKGGTIELSAGKFGGEDARVYAEGGKEAANRGFISVKGKGTISGVVSVNVGSE